jgi:hypothetical protein
MKMGNGIAINVKINRGADAPLSTRGLEDMPTVQALSS